MYIGSFWGVGLFGDIEMWQWGISFVDEWNGSYIWGWEIRIDRSCENC